MELWLQNKLISRVFQIKMFSTDFCLNVCGNLNSNEDFASGTPNSTSMCYCTDRREMYKNNMSMLVIRHLHISV
jgi:hypothetical protein